MFKDDAMYFIYMMNNYDKTEELHPKRRLPKPCPPKANHYPAKSSPGHSIAVGAPEPPGYTEPQ